MVNLNQFEVDRIGAVIRAEEANRMSTWMYISCRLLAARGLLEFKGMSTRLGQPDYFVYGDPQTGAIYAVQRPAIGADAEGLLVDRMVTLTRGLPN
ncbi:MAG TPA: hypothetical protein VGM51_15440 [Armatimonadota bacterium]|jgi:hypothetical protein